MLQNDCERLSLDMTIIQSEKKDLEHSEVDELQHAHERLVHVNTYLFPLISLSPRSLSLLRTLEGLRNRIEELETVESELVHSETRVKELERKLRNLRHNEEFLQSQQQKLIKFDELERQVRHLTEENAAMKRHQDNTDLLRYKVQTLQDKCAKYEGLESKVAQLELVNQELRETIKEEGSGVMPLGREGGEDVTAAGEGSRSLATLWYKISQLQQKEVMLTVEKGELMTR